MSRRTPTTRMLLAALAALALFAAGCGSNDDCSSGDSGGGAGEG